MSWPPLKLLGGGGGGGGGGGRGTVVAALAFQYKDRRYIFAPDVAKINNFRSCVSFNFLQTSLNLLHTLKFYM